MTTESTRKTQEQLVAENAELRVRLAEAEDTLRAIRSGEVDALVVTGEHGEQIFTLTGADRIYRVLVENMSEGTLTLTLDGMILYANRRFAEMLKMPLEKVIGSTLHAWLASDSPRFLEALLQAGGAAPRRQELTLIASDGTLVPVYLSANPLDLDELPDSFCLVVTDITERKRAEEALQRNQAMLARTESIAHLGSWEWDVATDTVTWSDELFRIFQRNPAAGAPSFAEHPELYYPEDMQRLRAAVEAAVSNGTPYELELRAIRKDGATRVCLARGHAGIGPEKRVTRLVGSLQDITERKQAEQRAFELALERERMALLTKFINDVSHEFRTPLTIIQTSIYLLGRLEDPAKRQRKLAQIGEQVTGIVRLVELLVEMARLDSGVPFITAPTDLNQWITAEAGKVGGAVAAKGLTLQLALAPDLPPVAADGNRLGRALHELLDNAVRFTPAGGRVTVLSTSDAAGVTVEVQDSGPGIAPEALPHIFERFYRQDVAHTTPGFGLGLPIARAIVERHGGRLEVESQPGAGSVFRITLPA